MSTTPPPPETPPPDPSEQPTQAAPEPPRRLLRSRRDRVFAGVAGGLGQYLAIDPVIVRIVLVVLVFFGGAGALLYLAAVLLVPEQAEGAAAPPAPAATTRNRALVIVGIVVACIVLAPLSFAIGSVIVPLAFLALIGLAVGWLVTGRRPAREAGPMVRTALIGLGVLALCWVLALAAFWAAGVGGEAFVAGAVIAAGVAVLVGAFVKPVRWLVLPALAIALPAAFVSAAGISLDGGYGERSYRPTSSAAIADRYELGAGRMVVDLRGADLPAGDRRLALELGMGEAVVIVDPDVCVSTDAEIGAGQADVLDRGSGGLDIDFVEQTAARPGGPRLVVDADIGLGHLDIRKTDPDDHDRFDRAGPPWAGRWGEDDFDRRGSNTACA